MKIQKFNDYYKNEEMAYLFLNSFDQLIKESNEEEYIKVKKKVLKDLKINFEFVLTFGAGINALFPIVDNLLFNQGNIEVTKESVVLTTICAIAIIYLEERKPKSIRKEEELTKDSKSMLEELKLKGIGNGIVKKVIKAIKSINNIFLKIGEYIGKASLGIIDMFAYISLLIPVMNGIDAIINQYNLNLDTIVQNLMGIGLGVATIVAKNGIIEIVKRLKDKISDKKKKEIIDDIEEEPIVEPVIKKFSEIDNELINEQ